MCYLPFSNIKKNMISLLEINNLQTNQRKLFDLKPNTNYLLRIAVVTYIGEGDKYIFDFNGIITSNGDLFSLF